MARRASAKIVVLALGLATQSGWGSARIGLSAGQALPKPLGAIVGLVTNERHEPVANATVQAFIASGTGAEGPAQLARLLKRSYGSAPTDDRGHFQISGLLPGDYLVAAEPISMLPSIGTTRTVVYATTFYPSTVDERQAAHVLASEQPGAPVSIELVRVQGARVGGQSRVHPDARPLA